MNKEDATPAAVAPVVGQITTALKNAINQAQALKGQPSDVVMAGGAPGEVVPLQNVAKLVADVLLVRIFLLSLQSSSVEVFPLAPYPDSRWPPSNHWTYRRFSAHSWTSWVSYKLVQVVLEKLNIIVLRPLLTSLLTTLIPVVIGLVAALIPLVSGLLASVSGLVTALGLGGLIVALGL